MQNEFYILMALFILGMLQGEAETIKFKPEKAWINSPWWKETDLRTRASVWIINNVFSFALGGFHLLKSFVLLGIFLLVHFWAGLLNWWADPVIMYVVYSFGFLISYHDWL